jgi:hypothetical protein
MTIVGPFVLGYGEEVLPPPPSPEPYDPFAGFG